MLLRVCSLFIVASSTLAAEPLVVVVTANYAGANAKVVAETIAAPIDFQLEGVEGSLRIESISRNDGSYTARVRFKANTDVKNAVMLVQNRVALANPQLPEEARRAGVKVKLGKPDETEKAATIALLDKGEHGGEALREWSANVLKKIQTEDAMWKPTAFPIETEKQIVVDIDRVKCEKAGINIADVFNSMKDAGKDATIENMKEIVVTSREKKVPLSTIAKFREVTVPVAVYCVNGYPAVRITADSPEGRNPAETAAKWMKLVEAKKGFAVENLTGK